MKDEDELIDFMIQSIATAFDAGKTLEEIVKLLEFQNVSSDNIFLIIKAAEIIHNDRKNAPPKKLTLFRREKWNY